MKADEDVTTETHVVNRLVDENEMVVLINRMLAKLLKNNYGSFAMGYGSGGKHYLLQINIEEVPEDADDSQYDA